jgi:hypothetical protein
MKNKYSMIKNKLRMLFLLMVAATTVIAQPSTQTFSHTAATQTFTVPPCVGTMSFDLKGAKGGTGYLPSHQGGNGGRVTGVISVTPGQILQINVGGVGINATSSGGGMGGFNGGGTGASYSGSYGGGGGGGASDVRVAPFGLADRILVAGGGGGGAYNYGTTDYDRGGMGGGTTGESGYGGNNPGAAGGGGGTQSSGGFAGYYSGYCTASTGALGVGGNGGTCTNSGGGGGGGYYGGGGGVWGGGGGGSNYAASTASSVIHTQGFQTGNGLITFSFVTLGNPMYTTVTPSTGLCSGLSSTLSASGVNSYTWNNGSNNTNIVVTPASTQNYTIMGTNNFGCVITTILTVTVLPLPNITANFTPTLLCVGKTATISATGATSYVWDTGATTSSTTVSPAVSTSYTVTGTDNNGCANTDIVTVNVNTVTIGVPATVSVCLGNTVSITAANAVSYLWSTNAMFPTIYVVPTANTTYSVNAVDIHGCELQASVPVTVIPKPTVNITPSKAVICQGESSNLTAAGNGDTFLWNNGSTGSSITVKPAFDLPYGYTVTASSAAGCSSSATFTLQVNKCTGLQEVTYWGNLQISPNPSAGVFNISTSDANTNSNVKVYNTIGKLIRSESIVSENTRIDLESEASGVYIVYVTSNNKVTHVSKIIKQ